jgi:hypothetical protein
VPLPRSPSRVLLPYLSFLSLRRAVSDHFRMAPAVGVESATLLPAPRPLDVAMPASAAMDATTTAAAVTDLAAAGDSADAPPGGASTALKLADCIGRVSAALAELGATVEALKGEYERRGGEGERVAKVR